MPIVTIQVTREGSGSGRNSVTPEQKTALIAGVSQLLLEILHKPLDSTFVVIEEVALENWGSRRSAGCRISQTGRQQEKLIVVPMRPERCSVPANF